MNRQLTFLMINDELAKTDRQTEYYVCPGKPLSGWQKVSDGLIKCSCKQIYRGNMPVTELYAFNLICENLLAALYGVAIIISNWRAGETSSPIWRSSMFIIWQSLSIGILWDIICYVRQQLPQDRAEWDKIAKDKVEDKKVSANESKVKGLGQASFPKGLRGSRGQSLLGALAAVVNYVYLRNPFADGINDWPDSRQIKKS